MDMRAIKRMLLACPLLSFLQGMTGKTKLLIMVAIAVIATALIVIPNSIGPRFDSASVSLAVRVQVLDRKTEKPIAGATVLVPSFHEESVTSEDGQCEAIAHFRTTGIVGRPGKMPLHGTMKVSAPGYQNWEQSFVSIFGPNFDRSDKGTSVTYPVSLNRLPIEARR